MSNRFHPRCLRRVGIAVAAVLVLGIVPAAAQAAPVNLATASPFVVLGGAGVTNTEPSVLNGDLGVSPGTSLTGFGSPPVVNGAIHANDTVAAQAQADLGTAYSAAAGQPVPFGNDLTGVDLGGLSLGPGAYGYSSSAQLTGQLTLDAHGDPNAQFVFVIGTALTTATASSVVLTDGASPCNVYWKVGSSATLGTSTSFEGSLMAQESISLGSGVTVQGRMLARSGSVTLIDDVLTAPQCATASTPPPTGPGAGGSDETATGGSSPTRTTPTGTTPGETGGTSTGRPGKKGKETTQTKAPVKTAPGGTATLGRGKKSAAGVRAEVHGKRIRKVRFTDNGEPIGSPGSHHVRIPATPGVHVVVVHVSFTDSTPSKTMRFRFRVPTPLLRPHQGPSQFTG